MIIKNVGNVAAPNGISVTTSVPGSGAAAVVTLPALDVTSPAKQTVHTVQWSYSATPANGRLTIVDSVPNTLLDVDITASGPGGLSGYWMGTGALTITLGGVAATQGKLSVQSTREA